MYVVLGASGNTGHVVASKLLAAGKKVRVVGRNASHLQALAAKGAEAVIADLTEADSLARAFEQADSAYVMIPPNPTSIDPLGYSNRVSDAIAAAIKNSGTQHVVALSSIGADKPSGTGPVVGIHNLEQKLNQIDDTNVLCLRAGYFMENTLPQANAIHQIGSALGPLRPDLRISMIATRDIGEAAAEALLQSSFSGKQTRELQGQRDLTYNGAATIMGKAIDKPDLKYIQIPDDQFRGALVQMGMSEQFARVLTEMTSALNSGYMRALESRSPQNTTPTKFETFVAETFVPAYKQQTAA